MSSPARVRPLSVTVVAMLYMAVGVIGFIYHFRELLALHADAPLIEITEVLAAIAGFFILRGANWARWLAIAWMALHVVISYPELPAFPIHCAFLLVIAWILLRPAAGRWFRPAA